MSIITEKTYAEQSTIKTISNFFKQYRLGSALKQAGAYKQKGIPVATVFMYLLSLVYTGKSMFQDMRSTTPFAQGLSKDTVYRFLNRMHINWQALLLSISLRVVVDIDRLTSDDRNSAFIVDDTMYEALYAKKRELASLVHDHAAKGKQKYKWGYRMLSLCWSDGVSLVPVAFRHLASADEKNQRCGAKPGLDKRSRAYSIRKEAVSKATDVLLILLKATLNAGIIAKHVLFDTWFAYPATIIKIVALGLNVTARVKDTTKIKYLVNGERKTAREIFN
ncbi:MAG: transposase, partial [Clostridiales bacterium]|nr:transposase [Clostridiales bacterium]